MRTPWSATALCAVPLVLAGCAGSSASSSGAATTTFTIATDAVTTTLEPSKYDNISHRFAQDPVKGTLLEYQNFEESDGQVPGPDDLKPSLATSFDVGEDGITLQLGDARSAAGSTLSADDVKFTFDRILALEDPIALSLMTNAGIDPDDPVTVVNEHEVTINAKVNALSAQTLDSYRFSILDSATVSPTPPTRPLGHGLAVHEHRLLRPLPGQRLHPGHQPDVQGQPELRRGDRLPHREHAGRRDPAPGS